MTSSKPGGEDFYLVQVTIPSGQALSDVGNIGKGALMGIILPTIDSASISFQVSADGTNFVDLYDTANAEITYPASTGARALTGKVGLSLTASFPYIKVRSGVTATPVNQTANRVVTLVCRNTE